MTRVQWPALTMPGGALVHVVTDSDGRTAMTIESPSDAIAVVTVLSRTVVVTDAQIKGMRDNPVEIIANTSGVLAYSGTASELFVPVMAFAFLDTTGGEYADAPNPMSLWLCWGSDNSIGVTVATHSSGGASADKDALAAFTSSTTRPDFFFVFPPARQNAAFITNNLQDNGLYLTFTGSGSGDLTGGNAANSMSITVYYTIVDVP